MRSQPGDWHLRFYEKDLRVKITAILLLLVVVGLVAALVISTILARGIIRNQVEEAMFDAARMSRSLLGVALERRSSRVELMANYSAIAPTDKLSAFSLFLEAWPIGKGIAMLDTAGDVLCGTGNLGSIGSARGTEWFDIAQSARVAFSYINRPEELARVQYDSPVLAVSSPLRDANEQIYAYLVCFTTLSDIWRAVDTIKILDSGHGVLADESGEIVAGYLFRKAGRQSPEDAAVSEKTIRTMTSGRRGSGTSRFRSEEFLFAYTPAEQTATLEYELGWYVGVVVPSGEAYAPANTVTWALLGLTLFFIALGSLIAVLLGRSITRPINELVMNAERIGSGDLTGEVIIRTRDQIGSLAASFLRMRDYLRSALAEAGYTADKAAELAGEQSAATAAAFESIDEIVESVIMLARNMESQTQKIRAICEYTRRMPQHVLESPVFKEVEELLGQAEILAEVGANKAVEIATAAQEERASARDISSAARRLSAMSRELKEMVRRFKVSDS